jgi:hypothetical protein
LKNTQPPPTMDGIILVTFDGLLHGATNEPMKSMLEDWVWIKSWLMKNNSNPNTINEQLQLIVLFGPL